MSTSIRKAICEGHEAYQEKMNDITNYYTPIREERYNPKFCSPIRGKGTTYEILVAHIKETEKVEGDGEEQCITQIG